MILPGQSRKKTQIIHIAKEEGKLSLFLHIMKIWFYIWKIRVNFLKNLLELINEFSKVSEYNIPLQKLTVFLYINNEHISGFFWKDTKAILWMNSFFCEWRVFFDEYHWNSWIFICIKINFDSYIALCPTMNSKLVNI